MIRLFPIVLLPLVDLLLLIWIGRHTSGTVALALVLAGFLLGFWLLRRWGRTLQAELNARKAPGAVLAKGVATLVSAVLFIIPGVLSDALALLLLFPLGRRLAALWVASAWRGRFVMHGFGDFADQAGATPSRDHVIDVQVVEPATSARSRAIEPPGAGPAAR